MSLKKIRINKYLSECGVASRRKSEEYITQGRVMINGKTVSDLSAKIEPFRDDVKLDGETVRPETKAYILLNKPAGVVTTTSDEKGRQDVTDIVKTNLSVFPVGRLDMDTTGSLLMTNDGDLANFLTHPSNKIPRVYAVLLDKKLEKEDKDRLAKGIKLDGRNSLFTRIEFPNKKSFKEVVVTTVEGRNHFVKRMFDSLGYTVEKLHRISFGNFYVDNIAPGTYKRLTYKTVKESLKEFGYK